MNDDANHVVGKYVCSRYDCAKVSEVDTEMGAMCMEHSAPLLMAMQMPREGHRRGVTRYVPWEFVKPHERQALINHYGQTLARLSERGGLDVFEMLAVVTGQYCRLVQTMSPEEAHSSLEQLVREWELTQRARSS